MLHGDYDGAGNVYAAIRALDLSPGMNEAVALRLVIAGAPDLREYLAPVLAGTMSDSVALVWLSGINAPDNPAALSYLRGKLLAARGDYASAVRETAEYFAPFTYPALNGALNDVAAGAYFRLEDFLSARAFYERTLDYDPGAVLAARVRERQERCLWFEREWKGLKVSCEPAR
jgi:tetratricopeptide (TPR) repeat protein